MTALFAGIKKRDIMIELPWIHRSSGFIIGTRISSLDDIKEKGTQDDRFAAMLGYLSRNKHLLTGTTSELFVTYPPEVSSAFYFSIYFREATMMNWYHGYNCAAAFCETLERTKSKYCRAQIAMNQVVAYFEPNGPNKQADVQKRIDILSYALAHGWKTGAAVRKWVADNINPDWPVLKKRRAS
jgi:hypothetical protein